MNKKIAYLGPPGTFTEEALTKFLGNDKEVEKINKRVGKLDKKIEKLKTKMAE